MNGRLNQDLPRLHLNFMSVASVEFTGDLVTEVRSGEVNFAKSEIKLRRIV